MLTKENAHTKIRENLKDAGCDENKIAKFMLLLEAGQSKEQQLFLARHRKSLLGSLHQAQNQIDCLDYLVYKLKL